MKRSGNVFPSDMTHGQYISLQRSWKVKVTFLPYGFSLITFEPSTMEIKFERRRVPLVKTHRNVYKLTWKGQGQNLTSGQGHGVTQAAYESMRIDETNTLRPVSCL